MKLRVAASFLIASAILLGCLVSETDGAAFVRVNTAKSNNAGWAPSTSRLRFTDWESEASSASSTSSRFKKKSDPSNSIQSYLPPPQPAVFRPNLEGAVLVSGFSDDHTGAPTQRIFDLLHDEESAFAFDKIIAFVDDVKSAKKRLVSRSARYSGLLDKLDFVQSDEESKLLPTPEQLAGVKHWVAHVGDDVTLISKIGDLLKKSADVENVSVLLTGATELDVYQSEDAVKSLQQGSKSFTIVAVGDHDDDELSSPSSSSSTLSSSSNEGTHPYTISDFGTRSGKIPQGSTYSRDGGLRLVAECLGLECASGRAMSFTEVRDVNATEHRLLRGLREAGYSWSQEIEHMISSGAERYEEACRSYDEEEKTKKASWLDAEDEKLRKAQEAEIERQEAMEAEWVKSREEEMERERVKMEEGLAEWA